MTVEDKTCNECGAQSWRQVLTQDYPEARRERDRTVKRVYACEQCDSEGRHFVHNAGGADTYSGSLR